MGQTPVLLVSPGLCVSVFDTNCVSRTIEPHVCFVEAQWLLKGPCLDSIYLSPYVDWISAIYGNKLQSVMLDMSENISIGLVFFHCELACDFMEVF